MAVVYILKSVSDGRFYVGSTKDLKQRLRHHHGGFTSSTKRFGIVTLVFSQEFPSLKEARLIEKKLKKFKRKDYIDKIVREGEIKFARVAQPG